MKICIIASGDFFGDYGGGQVYVRSLVDSLSRLSDVDVAVVSVVKNADNIVREYNGIAVYVAGNVEAIRGILAELRPDVVHANGEKLAVAEICREMGIPCVVTMHHGGLVCPAGTLMNTRDEICDIAADYKPCLRCYLRMTPTGPCWHPITQLIGRKAYIALGARLKKRRFIPLLSPIAMSGAIVDNKIEEWRRLRDAATMFVAPSSAAADALTRNGCDTAKIAVVPHGIPSHGIPSRCIHAHDIPSRDTTHRTDDGKVRFYYTGRICHVKGIHVLLKAFHGIDNSNIELHLIGGAARGDEQRYMRHLQRRYRNDSRIVWHGKVGHEALHTIIDGFDALVHPAIYLEVFGLNIAEAIDAGKYVIATRCGGAEMQILSEKDGVLVAPNDTAALRHAMEEYARHPATGSGKAIDINSHVATLTDLYQQVATSTKQHTP